MGNRLSGYNRAPVMYGGGLGGLFQGLLRMAEPFLQKCFNMAKPHLKVSTQNIATDVKRSVIAGLLTAQPQEGSSLMVLA